MYINVYIISLFKKEREYAGIRTAWLLGVHPSDVQTFYSMSIFLDKRHIKRSSMFENVN